MIPLMLLSLQCWAQASPDELLDEARRRAVVGDFEGARIVATEARDQPGEHQLEARYLLAIALEYGGDPLAALELYDALLQEDLGDRLDDVRFRRAETLGRLHRYAEAMEQLESAWPEPDQMTPSDEVKLSILQSLWQIEQPSRRDEREGLSRLEATLATAATIDAPAYQAQARGRLVDLAIAHADAIELNGGKRRKGKRLEQRAGLVTGASEQLATMIRLQAPRHTLGAFLAVGHGFEAFGQAMLDESRVRGLSPDQREIYDRERASRVEQVWIKASRYYGKGVEYAGVAAWEGPETERLRAAYDGVIQRIEALELD